MAYHKHKHRPLTLRQQRFIEQYLILGNATEAARRVGYTTLSAGVHLKQLPHIAEAIRLRRSAEARRAQIDRATILRELARIAFSDMGELADWGPKGVKLLEKSDVPADQRAAVAEIATSRVGGSARIRLHNKQHALDSIARHLGFFERDARHQPDGPAARLAAADSARAKLRARIEALAAAQREAPAEKSVEPPGEA